MLIQVWYRKINLEELLEKSELKRESWLGFSKGA